MEDIDDVMSEDEEETRVKEVVGKADEGIITI